MVHGALVKRLCGVAALLWAASWFLPAASEMPGWMAFRNALSSLWPYESLGTARSDHAVPHVLSAMTNVVFVVLLAFVLGKRRIRPQLFILVAGACFMLNLYWFVQFQLDGKIGHLLIGYYAWQLAFALLIVSGVLIHRTSKTPTAGTPA